MPFTRVEPLHNACICVFMRLSLASFLTFSSKIHIPRKAKVDEITKLLATNAMIFLRILVEQMVL